MSYGFDHAKKNNCNYSLGCFTQKLILGTFIVCSIYVFLLYSFNCFHLYCEKMNQNLTMAESN